MTDAILEWYVPFFAAIYVIEDQEDILFLLKIVCVSAILIALGGIIEFRMERNIFLGMLPKSFLDDFLANNPTFARGLEAIYRNGIYRASSIFAVSNSFGEFEAIVVPIGLFFAAYGRTVYSKGLGCAAVVAAMAGIVVSGARCGYIAFLPTTALFAVIWAFRKARENKASLAPAFVMVAGGMGFLLTIAAILFLAPRARAGFRRRLCRLQHAEPFRSVASRLAAHLEQPRDRPRLFDGRRPSRLEWGRNRGQLPLVAADRMRRSRARVLCRICPSPDCLRSARDLGGPFREGRALRRWPVASSRISYAGSCSRCERTTCCSSCLSQP